MDQNSIIECGGFYFIHNFDSGNLGHVERVPTELLAPSLNTKTNATETPDYEFNMWTRPDCAGTEFENGNRTWFYFGVQASEAGVLREIDTSPGHASPFSCHPKRHQCGTTTLACICSLNVRLNLINLNKQGKMYNQGMAPVTRTLPGKPQWERIRDRPVHSTDDNTFTLTFKYRTPDNLKATTFFAFTYPFSFAELQIALNSIDLKMLPPPTMQSPDDIYYCRECLIYSLEGRRVDLLTITSYHGITNEREDRLKNLFPDNQDRPFKFQNKKVIFISARVHPGETPSSFVFNGFLNLLLNRNDPIAIQLRRLYVFKMIPFLNPDGVARGHYRTDTRGVNLNRVYLNPSLVHHPTVYASRALIRYYHFGCEKEDNCEDIKSYTSRSIQNISESVELLDRDSSINKKKKDTSTTTSTNKSESFKQRGKSLSTNKSSTTIKQPSIESRKESKVLSGEASILADQVYDMKLQEQPSQTSEPSSKPSNTNLEETFSFLNDNVIRNCLGSNVHISTSEELNLAGGNPLRPLRDALKNSISLLMESSSSNAGDSSLGGAESRLKSVRMGWCSACRAAVCKLESTMPGITSVVPGYSAMARADPAYYTSIEEYRKHQRQQFDALDLKANNNDETDKSDDIYFCTNCFKRYLISDQEEIKLSESVSCTSVGVPCGESGDVSAAQANVTDADLPPLQTPSPSKEEKPKSPVSRARKKTTSTPASVRAPPASAKEPDSGLFLYIDLHGHASKKGIFMYGNHFEDVESCVECMLLPRIMSLNNLHFHFSSCNFTERNMYLKDRRDGMSREGSGRVAVLKATGLVRSYTLECNYNTGRLVNVLPPAVRDAAPPLLATPPPPPKYTPHIFEEVGRSLGASILDLTGAHPNSRIPCSEHRNLSAVREWLRAHTRTVRPQLTMSRLRPKTSSPTRAPLFARSKAKVVDERKENTYVGAKDTERRRSPSAAPQRSHHDIINMNMKFVKKNEAVKTASRTKYLAENEPKPKTLSTKRRNILAIRKPNASKTQVGSVKAKTSRRSVDDAEGSRASVTAKLSKRSFSRSIRDKLRSNKCRAMASSSSDDVVGGAWEEVAGGTVLGAAHAEPVPPPAPTKRRPLPNPAPAPAHLKKIRLKASS